MYGNEVPRKVNDNDETVPRVLRNSSSGASSQPIEQFNLQMIELRKIANFTLRVNLIHCSPKHAMRASCYYAIVDITMHRHVPKKERQHTAAKARSIIANLTTASASHSTFLGSVYLAL